MHRITRPVAANLAFVASLSLLAPAVASGEEAATGMPAGVVAAAPAPALTAVPAPSCLFGCEPAYPQAETALPAQTEAAAAPPPEQGVDEPAVPSRVRGHGTFTKRHVAGRGGYPSKEGRSIAAFHRPLRPMAKALARPVPTAPPVAELAAVVEKPPVATMPRGWTERAQPAVAAPAASPFGTLSRM